ncbi:MAG: GatB/YqeY domain-containing protein [Patescibacteria group bacterium]
MTVQERLRGDLVSALKSGDAVRAVSLRCIIAELHNREIEKRGALSDGDISAVLRREAKKRKESVGLFKKGGREDLAAREEQELLLLSGYLPPEVPAEEIERTVNGLIAGGISEFASLMRETMKQFKDRVDGKVVQDIVQKKIAGNSH